MISTEYRFSEDPAELDLECIVRWISQEAYWAKGREPSAIERSFANSFAVGAYGPSGQVAVARIVSDLATFAWLCDVFVDPGHRGRGLGTRIAHWAVEWAEQRSIPRIVLATVDAHGVYANAGFTPLAHPQRWMQIDRRPEF
ncbi:GNAT family N-acetyltransferase [Planosporangium mesophilum]|uniref:N-acetyltransferase n=1 Tax=Planosporangium mesophilum TaxID=689768 RepID=A0A8J3THA7_9ACTN|nr:GNAT family N-acetyltransferase [Planosporangium mesophilum]NJC86447.1 GNAT family N-acetyltransferase [Planosporangium mesophilum]GII25152.1 N-acetyltransferase [Planosporangium mesophilum]